MLQAVEVVIEPGGTIRALEEIKVDTPMRAVLTVLEPVVPVASEGTPEPARIRVATPKASLEELAAISRRCAALPVLDDRSPDQILGYADDPLGLPG